MEDNWSRSAARRGRRRHRPVTATVLAAALVAAFALMAAGHQGVAAAVARARAAAGAVLATAAVPGVVRSMVPRSVTSAIRAAVKPPAKTAGTAASKPPAPPAPGGDWTTYGNGPDNSFANPLSPVTAANVGQLRSAWYIRADGEVAGDPVAADGRVFFTTFSGSVYAVDRDTGRIRWTRSLGSAPIDGGPLYDGGRLYVAVSDGRLVALDAASGGVAWSTAPLFGGLADALRASPRAAGGVIYESLGGQGDSPREQGGVVALDERSGRVLWRTLLVRYAGGGAAVFSPPALLPQLGELVVATGNPVATGSNSPLGAAPPGPDPYSDSVVALSLADGHVLWAFQADAHDGSDVDFMAAPNVVTLPGGRLAVGAGSKDDTYYLLDARTGSLLWSSGLGAAQTDSLIMATAAVAGGRIFVGTMDVPGADAAAGRWPGNYQGPGTTGRVVALDAQTGRPLWSAYLSAIIAAAPVAGGDVVFALEANGAVVALDATSGHVLWQARAPGQVWNAEASLSLAGSTLLVPLANPGGLAAFALTH